MNGPSRRRRSSSVISLRKRPLRTSRRTTVRRSNAAEVPVRYRGARVRVAQLLAGPARTRVVIGVRRQVDERVEGEARVGAPRVDRRHAAAAALETPVLEVVDGLEQVDGDP